MLNVQSSIFAMGSFRRAGIHIAIDDFGTGFSSLSYLKHLPADVIKIDQSFVSDLTANTDDATIVSAVIGMARSSAVVPLGRVPAVPT